MAQVLIDEATLGALIDAASGERSTQTYHAVEDTREILRRQNPAQECEGQLHLFDPDNF